MILRPNAKVNLGLHVTGRLPNGYHSIETVYLPVPFCDELEITPLFPSAAQDTFMREGLTVDCLPENDLVLRAIAILRRQYTIPPVAVRLHKNIPAGAGLGGGSSDATFTLLGLRKLFGLTLSDQQLEEMAGSLGADCPVFIRNRPVLATGIGNVFTPIAIALTGYYLTIVITGIHSSTAEAYRLTTPHRPDYDLAALITCEPPRGWRDVLRNDFEDTVFQRHPPLADIKQCLYDAGAHYAALSGSGSSLFALFGPNETPTRLAETLAITYPNCRTITCRL